MKPYVRSRNAGTGWHQTAHAVSFEPLKWRYAFLYERLKVRQYYTLSFTLDFCGTDDVLEVAYCIPYTYSQLLRDISEI